MSQICCEIGAIGDIGKALMDAVRRKAAPGKSRAPHRLIYCAEGKSRAKVLLMFLQIDPEGCADQYVVLPLEIRVIPALQLVHSDLSTRYPQAVTSDFAALINGLKRPAI